MKRPADLRRPLLAAGLWLAGAAGCGDDTQYGYFAVDVAITEAADQNPNFLSRIASCGVNVEGADTDFASIGVCRLGAVQSRMLGTVEYSTAEKSGNVKFRVTIVDIAGKTMGEGVSPEVPITPGSTTRTKVDVVPTPDALNPPMS